MKPKALSKPLSIVNLTDRQIRNRLFAWYQSATNEQYRAGKKWYKEAQDFAQVLALGNDIDRYTAATVISCLSPNNKWGRNKEDASVVCRAWRKGKGPESVSVCTYNANKEKAFRALQGERISEKSPKTHAFAMNVGRLSDSHITVDKWHLRACCTTPKQGKIRCVDSCTALQYRRIERITAELARYKGIKGYELQAVIWVTIKDNWEGTLEGTQSK